MSFDGGGHPGDCERDHSFFGDDHDYMVIMIGIYGVDIMITMMTKLMIIRLAQDEEELTATMIRFVEEPEDRTKQARKVAPLTILNIHFSNISSSATSKNHIETPSDPPKSFTVP